ncbi:MAG: glycosyltransferase family 4 protein [Phycisphaeraceae bacterium]|nr:glycosyltransferase family 4 protein [Phycisphaeraceae bacterium]
MTPTDHPAPTLRVAIQQPALPRYRVPFFRELARRPGLDVTVYHADHATGPPSVASDGFKSQLVPDRVLRPFGLIWHAPISALTRPGACDVVVLAANLRYVNLIPALLRCRRRRIPCILWGHGYARRPGRAGWKLRLAVSRLATALVFYNHTTRRRYLDAGFPPDRVFVALNALEQDPIQKARQAWLDRPADLADFRRQHNLDKGPVLLFVSRLYHEKKPELMIQTTRLLVQRHPTLRTIIIGKGDLEPAVRQMVRDMNLEPNVLFAGEIYGEDQLAPYFLSSDLFVYPRRIGLSLLHAMGYGLPIVTSDALDSSNPEVEALRDRDNAWLYPGEDPKDLADAVTHLLADEPLRRRLGESARRTVLEEFNIPRMADGMEQAIRYAYQRCHA